MAGRDTRGYGSGGYTASAGELERGERFLAAYNVIERAMQRMTQDPTGKDGFRRLVDILSDRDWTVRKFRDDLIEFAELRNAIVHERTSPRFLIAVPLEGTVRKIESVAAFMEKPPLVYPRFRRNVVTFRDSDPMRDVLGAVNKTGYSQFPIYRDGRYIGLLTGNGIARWVAGEVIARGGDGFDIAGATAGTALDSEKDRDRAKFIERDATIYQAESMFARSGGDRSGLSALLITDSGSPSEKLLGIVTPSDILTLDNV